MSCLRRPSSSWLSFTILATIIYSDIIGSIHGHAHDSISHHKRKKKDVSSEQSTGSHFLGTSGDIFTGERIREYAGPKLNKNIITKNSMKHKNSIFENHRIDDGESLIGCTKWSVVTTIYEISLAIHRTLKMGSTWCTVVVADRKTPVASYVGLKRLVLLTKDDQIKISESSPFVNAMPWDHFGRKNIGYLYAMSRGAQYIFDFDDDNELRLNLNSSEAVSPLPSPIDKLGVAAVDTRTTNVFNPYLYFRAKNRAAWPRGFPLANITQSATYDVGIRHDRNIGSDSVAIFQALANHDPDVDAIFRLTQRHSQFDFGENIPPIVVPAGIYTPFIAQSTVHFPWAYMFMFLPISVPGRVSDIWRSYIAQRLLWDAGKYIAFTKPMVIQKRTTHNFMRDFDAEQDLYYKSGAFINFLAKWDGSHLPSMPERMELLYIDLFERNYIKLSDVLAVQAWLTTLIEEGHDFPKPLRTRQVK